MADFLTTKGIASEIDSIIRKAKEGIVLVSPYLKINDTFYERLMEASVAKIPITILYGKKELSKSEMSLLSSLSSLRLHYFHNLHAKCYYNESKLIITSMNMYTYSEINNREMGISIDKEKDPELYDESVKEVESILGHSEIDYLGSLINKHDDINKYSNSGFCIRCENKIDYNLDKPYCTDCFYSWQGFENVNYQENVCHNCGEYNSSTMMKPECWSCYSNN